MTKETGFDGLTRRYYRDPAGQVTSVKRPDGRYISYEYDPVGRVTKVIYNPDDDKPQEETYEYRRDGALICAVNSDAEVTLERDMLGRVTKETCNGQTVSSRYDQSGNRTNITSGFDADIRADYNLMGDLVSLANGGWQTGYQFFTLNYGGSMIKNKEIYGFHNSELMDDTNIVELTESYREDEEGDMNYLIIGSDYSGNSIGIDKEGKIVVYDHDELNILGNSLEEYILEALK